MKDQQGLNRKGIGREWERDEAYTVESMSPGCLEQWPRAKWIIGDGFTEERVVVVVGNRDATAAT